MGKGIVEALEMRTLFASPHLVKDINQQPLAIDPGPDLAQLNGDIYFTTIDDSQTQLWKSNGTAGGTELLHTFGLGSYGFNPLGLTPMGNEVFFIAEDENYDQALWKTDGTPQGTTMVLDPGDADPEEMGWLCAVGNTLYFLANDGVHGLELWKSDGTAFGTTMVADLVPGPEGVGGQELTAVGNRVFFWTSSENDGFRLLQSDGTALGTHNVLGSDKFVAEQYFAFDNRLYFVQSADDGLPRLWCTDGSNGGTVMVGDVGSQPRPVGTIGSDFYFSAYTSDGLQLWKIQSTAPTQAVQISAFPTQERGATLNGRIYFAGWDDDHGSELWSTNGAPGGTARLVDLEPGDSSSYPSNMVSVGGRLYFEAFDGFRVNLWTTDGTAMGTTRITGGEFEAGAFIRYTIAAGGHLFVLATDNVNQTCLWRIDGTVATKMDLIATGTWGSSPEEMLVAGGVAYFNATDDSFGPEMWVTDGTEAGTHRLDPSSHDFVRSHPFLYSAGLLYFLHDDGPHGDELWRTDGTPAGTFMLADIRSGPFSSYPMNLVAHGGKVYFMADDLDHGAELWQTDGTVEGTSMAFDFWPGGTSSFPTILGSLGNDLIVDFWDENGLNGLWKTDGTLQGTELILSINLFYDYEPQDASKLGNVIVFTADDALNGRQLWRTDGTSSGTYILHDFGSNLSYGPYDQLVVGSALYFVVGADEGNELWKTDGTVAGTVRIQQVESYDLPFMAPHLSNLNGKILFVGSDSEHGRELWITDGTPGGTHMYADVTPGPDGTVFGESIVAGDHFYFVAAPDRYSFEAPLLWRSDGTAAGTSPVEGVSRFMYVTDPLMARNLNGTLLFVNPNPRYGREVWALDETAPVVQHSTLKLDNAQTLHVQFSELVGASLSATDLLITPLAGGASFSPDSCTYDPVTKTAVFGFTRTFADGNYRATLAAGSVADPDGNTLRDPYSMEFFMLGGDANHDGKVDIADLRALASHWMGSNKTLGQGDFNYDRVVNEIDLGILARNWQQTLASPLTSVPSLLGAPRRSPTRIAELVNLR